uniref:(northern house mosquito) hypothetical protein n=1 Tax=Culex pipiens TaxID=7175 RepID=A0A8D8GZL8_CULPI
MGSSATGQSAPCAKSSESRTSAPSAKVRPTSSTSSRPFSSASCSSNRTSKSPKPKACTSWKFDRRTAISRRSWPVRRCAEPRPSWRATRSLTTPSSAWTARFS